MRRTEQSKGKEKSRTIKTTKSCLKQSIMMFLKNNKRKNIMFN